MTTAMGHGLVDATFTAVEIILIRDALATETVRMREHVAAQKKRGADIFGASLHLKNLENLLGWAKDACYRK